jgi:hypothetical protein
MAQEIETRPAIDPSDLTYEQEQNLKALHESTELRDAFDAVLRDRGLPMSMASFELGILEPHSASEPIGPDPDAGPKTKMPPPGGCYCCTRDKPTDPWVCYCC